MRNKPHSYKAVVAEIDALKAKLEAIVEDEVAMEHAQRPGVPASSHRHMLLRGDSNFFAAVRRLLIERGASHG